MPSGRTQRTPPRGIEVFKRWMTASKPVCHSAGNSNAAKRRSFEGVPVFK